MATLRVNGIKQELAKAFDSALQSLQVIWDQIGIDEKQRQQRVDAVSCHLSGLLQEMVKEEDSLKKRLLENVDKYGQDVIRMSKELAVPVSEPKEGLTILELEKDLRMMVDKLARERHERLKALKRLREADQELCNVLYSTPYYIPSGTVPSREKLDELEQHVKVLEEEKAQRQAVYRRSKKEIIQLMEELDKCPNTSFQREIISSNDESFVLSQDNMKALKSLHSELEGEQKENFNRASKLRERMEQLWTRLQVPEPERTAFSTHNTGFRPKTILALEEEIARCELLKKENLEQVIGKAKEELTMWWDKCYYSKEQRRAFHYEDLDTVSDDLLELFDVEVEKVKKYYQENKEMLDKVARRQILFSEFLEYERKAADPTRYYQRGCNLLKEEKARKRITKELPKVEEEVTKEIERWEFENSRQFLVGGVRFVDFIKNQWDEYNRQKEEEKKERAQAKAKQMEEELMFGSKPTTVTPGKRRLMNGTTPGKTPTKLRRIEQGADPLACSGGSTQSAASTCSQASSQASTVQAQSQPENALHGVAPLGDTMTPKTPGSSIRLGVTRNVTGVFASPALARSVKTPKSKLGVSGTANRTRKALGEKNDTLFSHTAVTTQPVVGIDNTIASVGHYTDFANNLNQHERENHRSSMLPKPAAFF